MIDPDRLNQLGAAALDTLETQAASGNTQAARILADYAVSAHRGKLAIPVQLPEGGLTTMEAVIETSETIATIVLAGSLSFEQGTKVLSMLRTYAEMRSFERLNELSEAIARLEQRQQKPLSYPTGMLPAWGRLAERQRKDSEN